MEKAGSEIPRKLDTERLLSYRELAVLTELSYIFLMYAILE